MEDMETPKFIKTVMLGKPTEVVRVWKQDGILVERPLLPTRPLYNQPRPMVSLPECHPLCR
jgi:hypothetical protein